MTRPAAVLLVALVLAACNPAPSPSPSPATSIAPASGATVLIRMDACTKAACLDPRRIQYWTDGTVIRLDPEQGRLVARRLTPAGLARVSARLSEDADLLGAELRADPVLQPGRTAPPYTGEDTYAFYPPAPAGVFLRISTVLASTLDRTVWQSTPRIDRLSALGAALLDPEALAQGGWSDPAWLPYDPPSRFVFVAARQGVPPSTEPDIGADDVQLGRGLFEFGVSAPSPLNAWPITRCARLTRAGADDLLAALPASAVPTAGRTAPLIRMSLGDATRSRELMVTILVPLPDELGLDCTDALLGYVW